MTELENDMKKTIEVLGRKLGTETEKIEKEVLELMEKENIEQYEALALWKKKNRRLFRSHSYDFLVFGKTKPRELKVKRRGEDELVETQLANLCVVVDTGSSLGVYTIGLWDKNAEQIKNFTIGKVYKARLQLNKNSYADFADDVIVTANNQKLDKIDSIMSMVSTKSIGEAENDIGTTGFYEGRVSRITEYGFEIDSMTSLPVMAWTSSVDQDLSDIALGDSVVVYGRVAESRRGDAVIYANAIHKKK